MTSLLETLKGASAPERDLYRPEFFRPVHPSGVAGLKDLLKREPRLTVVDHLHGQLVELVKALNPSIKFDPADLDAAAVAHLANTPSELYGVWVYYPWSNRLVHLLDEDEFALVRTDRNRNKITREEQAILATKRVGVIGLSVGQSVSLTLAQERSFGELRLADFDTLELSNLNRIRSGVHELGFSKVVNTAREIAEIDPFLRVTCFPEGITETNIDRFLTEGGNLDLLIEECDSVAVKIIARQKAKALRIPVVMDTSDRGLIDVERFDLEPNRPILHGLVDHLDLSLAAQAKTNEQKLPFVVPVIGLHTMSTRMKASMLEIESTVGTWPQLGSAVVMGGAIVADIHRRIALGQFTQSGRWFVDPEDLIADPQTRTKAPKAIIEQPTALTVDAMCAIAERAISGEPGGTITEEQAGTLVQAGALAPSAGNLQPWRFLHSAGRLLVFHDPAAGDSALDDGRLIPAVDMGTCLENIRLKGIEIGLPLNFNTYPLADEHSLVAIVERSDDLAMERDGLSAHINLRCTNRKKGDARPFPEAFMAPIRLAAEGVAGCTAHFISEPAALSNMAATIGEAERIRVLHPIGHYELFEKEMRWSTQAAEADRTGLDLPTMELKLSEEVGFRVARDREAMDLLAAWDTGRAFMKMTRDAMRSTSAVVLISCSGTDRRALLEAGRAVQRVWLKATELGLAAHPCSAPILLSHHVRHGGGRGMDTATRDALTGLFSEVRTAFDLLDKEPVFMLRLSFADAPTARSIRKTLSTLLHTHQTCAA